MSAGDVVKAHAKLWSKEEKAAADLLLQLGQEHVLASWPLPGTADDDKKRLLSQVTALNKQYPGGLAAYVGNARKLLADSKAGVNPFAGATPKVPEGLRLGAGDADFLKAETIGADLAKDCAFVLVAGGLGERLGYSGIKVALPSEISTGQSFLGLYIAMILGLEARSNGSVAPSDKAYRRIPLAIMTSGDTHDMTVSFLAANKDFGAAPGQVTIIKQEKVPALTDNDARFAVNSSDPFKIDTKPHGHGDVHALLHQSGLVKAWAKDGRRYVMFIQDTNALVLHAAPVMFGASEMKKMLVNTLTVPRKPKEAAGGIVRLEYDDGRALTVNVEYNQLDPLLKATVSKDGDVADATGNSPYPGNTNVLVFAVPEFAATLARTGGSVPEFVNPKYADADKTKFKKPTRLECMMQDYPRLLGPKDIVGFTQLDRFLCFSAVKNNLVDAAAKAKSGVPADSASSGEADVYAAWRWALAQAGVSVQPGKSEQYAGVAVQEGAHVVLDPSFAPTLAAVKERVTGGGKITAGSTLIVRGDVRIDNLDLDGALVVEAKPGASIVLKNLKVRNKGWGFKSVDPEDTSVAESLRIRGYTLDKKETREIICAKGANVIDK